MSYAEKPYCLEFDQEMANTRKVIERIPDDKLDWQLRIQEVPHHRLERQPPAQTSAGLGSYTRWRNRSLDIAPVGGEPYFSSRS